MKTQHILLCVALLLVLVGSTDAWGKKKAVEDEVMHAKKMSLNVLPMINFGHRWYRATMQYTITSIYSAFSAPL